jgi:aryl-alcohol dehydrogenase-like predicted oxidoreductase
MAHDVSLGPFRVAQLALGTMGMTGSYGPRDRRECIATIHEAIERGVQLIDTAEGYGPYVNEELVAEALATSVASRDRIVLATKFGFRIKGNRISGLCATPAQAQLSCDGSLKRLKTGCLDLLYLHRLDPQVPIEDSVGAMSRLVEAGKVRAIGLSEVSPRTLRRAHAVHPIAAVQSEYSLWERGAELEVRVACASLGVAFVAYSPLGRGFLTAEPPVAAHLLPGDNRARLPRFSQENRDANALFVDALKQVAERKQATVAQVALAWLLAKDPKLIVLFGSSKRNTLRDNLGALTLPFTAEEADALSALAPVAAQGDRYFAGAMAWLDKS